MPVYERFSGPHVAERIKTEAGSVEDARLSGLLGTDGWRVVTGPAPAGPTALPVPPESQPDTPVVEMPSQNDPKARWSFYVQQAHGVDPDDADAMTKQQLMDYQGGE